MTSLAGMLFNVGSYYLFVVPPHTVGCPDGCLGQAGYPLPIGTVSPSGTIDLYLGDFILNFQLIWLLALAASAFWRILAEAMDLSSRPFLAKCIFYMVVAVLPWATLPRYFAPPQPNARDEELRVAINALRAAETVYGITGLWIQRLGLEDIRFIPLQVPAIFGGVDQPRAQVCLRGYTYFYLPWRRYIVTLDRTGVTALGMAELPLDGPCW